MRTATKSAGSIDARIAKGNTWAIRRTLEAELNVNMEEIQLREREVKRTLTRLHNVTRIIKQHPQPNTQLQTDAKYARRPSKRPSIRLDSDFGIMAESIQVIQQKQDAQPTTNDSDTQTDANDFDTNTNLQLEAMELSLETLAQAAINMADSEMQNEDYMDLMLVKLDLAEDEAKTIAHEYNDNKLQLEMEKLKLVEVKLENAELNKALLAECAHREVVSNILPSALSHMENTATHTVVHVGVDTHHMHALNEELLDYAQEISTDFLPWVYTQAYQKTQFRLLYQQLQDYIFAEDETMRENSKEYMIQSLR